LVSRTENQQQGEGKTVESVILDPESEDRADGKVAIAEAMDGGKGKKKVRKPRAKTDNDTLVRCFVCGRKLQGEKFQSRLKHVRQCCRQYNVPTEEMERMLENHGLIVHQLGAPAHPTGASASGSRHEQQYTVEPKTKRRRKTVAQTIGLAATSSVQKAVPASFKSDLAAVLEIVHRMEKGKEMQASASTSGNPLALPSTFVGVSDMSLSELQSRVKNSDIQSSLLGSLMGASVSDSLPVLAHIRLGQLYGELPDQESGRVQCQGPPERDPQASVAVSFPTSKCQTVRPPPSLQNVVPLNDLWSTACSSQLSSQVASVSHLLGRAETALELTEQCDRLEDCSELDILLREMPSSRSPSVIDSLATRILDILDDTMLDDCEKMNIVRKMCLRAKDRDEIHVIDDDVSSQGFCSGDEIGSDGDGIGALLPDVLESSDVVIFEEPVDSQNNSVMSDVYRDGSFKNGDEARPGESCNFTCPDGDDDYRIVHSSVQDVPSSQSSC
jgi:DNA-directed RNA polymerase subunit N (RpoN/RPB10)